MISAYESYVLTSDFSRFHRRPRDLSSQLIVATQFSFTIRVLRVYCAGNEGDDEDEGEDDEVLACPALAWTNFSTAGTIMSSSWAWGFFACSASATCWVTQAAGACSPRSR